MKNRGLSCIKHKFSGIAYNNALETGISSRFRGRNLSVMYLNKTCIGLGSGKRWTFQVAREIDSGAAE